VYADVKGKESVDVKISSTATGKAILVDENNPLKNQLKIRSSASRTDFVADGTPNYTSSGEYRKGYFAAYKKYYSSNYNYAPTYHYYSSPSYAYRSYSYESGSYAYYAYRSYYSYSSYGY
jgi:hypothetical protein